MFWPFTVWIICSSDLKNVSNSRLSASNFKRFSRSLEHFFLTVGQNNFGNKIPFSLSRSERIWKQNTISKRFSAFLFPIYLLNLSRPFLFHVRVRYPIILSIKRPRKRCMGEFYQFFKIRRELIKNHDETCHFLCRFWCQSSCQKVQCVLFIIDCLRLRSFK